jgi:hypothetical protein
METKLQTAGWLMLTDTVWEKPVQPGASVYFTLLLERGTSRATVLSPLGKRRHIEFV